MVAAHNQRSWLSVVPARSCQPSLPPVAWSSMIRPKGKTAVHTGASSSTASLCAVRWFQAMTPRMLQPNNSRLKSANRRSKTRRSRRNRRAPASNAAETAWSTPAKITSTRHCSNIGLLTVRCVGRLNPTGSALLRRCRPRARGGPRLRSRRRADPPRGR